MLLHLFEMQDRNNSTNSLPENAAWTPRVYKPPSTTFQPTFNLDFGVFLPLQKKIIFCCICPLAGCPQLMPTNDVVNTLNLGLLDYAAVFSSPSR